MNTLSKSDTFPKSLYGASSLDKVCKNVKEVIIIRITKEPSVDIIWVFYLNYRASRYTYALVYVLSYPMPDKMERAAGAPKLTLSEIHTPFLTTI